MGAADKATVLLLTMPAGLEEFLSEHHGAAARYGIEFLHD